MCELARLTQTGAKAGVSGTVLAMLSEDDKQVLADLERQLLDDGFDPTNSKSKSRNRVISILALMACFGALLAAVSIPVPVLGVVAFAAALPSAYILYRTFDLPPI